MGPPCECTLGCGLQSKRPWNRPVVDLSQDVSLRKGSRACYHLATQRLLRSSFLAMTYFLLRDFHILPKKELHRSLWVVLKSIPQPMGAEWLAFRDKQLSRNGNCGAQTSGCVPTHLDGRLACFIQNPSPVGSL